MSMFLAVWAYRGSLLFQRDIFPRFAVNRNAEAAITRTNRMLNFKLLDTKDSLSLSFVEALEVSVGY